jgi:hypothetical protein
VTGAGAWSAVACRKNGQDAGSAQRLEIWFKLKIAAWRAICPGIIDNQWSVIGEGIIVRIKQPLKSQMDRGGG